jgi:hypothetical protein
LRRSLGGVAPDPAMTCRGTMVNPAAAAAASFRKVRRVVAAGAVSGVFGESDIDELRGEF